MPDALATRQHMSRRCVLGVFNKTQNDVVTSQADSVKPAEIFGETDGLIVASTNIRR
jgi:hypothetical protein